LNIGGFVPGKDKLARPFVLHEHITILLLVVVVIIIMTILAIVIVLVALLYWNNRIAW